MLLETFVSCASVAGSTRGPSPHSAPLFWASSRASSCSPQLSLRPPDQRMAFRCFILHFSLCVCLLACLPCQQPSQFAVTYLTNSPSPRASRLTWLWHWPAAHQPLVVRKTAPGSARARPKCSHRLTQVAGECPEASSRTRSLPAPQRGRNSAFKCTSQSSSWTFPRLTARSALGPVDVCAMPLLKENVVQRSASVCGLQQRGIGHVRSSS